jgi:hypothetical protein
MLCEGEGTEDGNILYEIRGVIIHTPKNGKFLLDLNKRAAQEDSIMLRDSLVNDH